jgi:hypothetical protein
MRSTILTFGPSRNARLWRDELAGLGVDSHIAIMQDEPPIARMAEFFATPSNWVYFSGHHISGHLFNRFPGATAGVRFHENDVEIYVRNESRTLVKDKGFEMHNSAPQVLFWGGCNVCESRRTIQTIRHLFNNPLILGYSESSGWKITHKIFTGTHLGRNGRPIPRLRGETDFFEQLGTGDLTDLVHVRNAWINTAIENYDRNRRQMFRAIDPNGQEWIPGRNSGAEGRTFQAIPEMVP